MFSRKLVGKITGKPPSRKIRKYTRNKWPTGEEIHIRGKSSGKIAYLEFRGSMFPAVRVTVDTSRNFGNIFARGEKVLKLHMPHKKIPPKQLALFARVLKLLADKLKEREGLIGVYFDTPDTRLVKFLKRLGCTQVSISEKTMVGLKRQYSNSVRKGFAPPEFDGHEVQRFVYRF